MLVFGGQRGQSVGQRGQGQPGVGGLVAQGLPPAGQRPLVVRHRRGVLVLRLKGLAQIEVGGRRVGMFGG